MALLDRIIRRGIHLDIPNLGARVLESVRIRAMEETLEWAEARVRPLVEHLARGNADARATLGHIAEEAMGQMRVTVRAQARRAGFLPAMFARLDAWWANPTQGEYIDDPDLDPALRQRAMAHLDAVNESAGSYDLFLDFLEPVFDAIDDRPVRVMDLAAGHGGFALHAARRAREEGRALDITATDIKPEYLELGARLAREEDLEVRFQIQDALDLSNLEAGYFDAVVCTQSLHHFAPGAAAVMIQEAARAAGHRVIFADGVRTLAFAMPLYAILRVGHRDALLAHDGWISCRRFYAPEELLLLARLGPWGEAATFDMRAAFLGALVLPTNRARTSGRSA